MASRIAASSSGFKEALAGVVFLFELDGTSRILGSLAVLHCKPERVTQRIAVAVVVAACLAVVGQLLVNLLGPDGRRTAALEPFAHDAVAVGE